MLKQDMLLMQPFPSRTAFSLCPRPQSFPLTPNYPVNPEPRSWGKLKEHVYLILKSHILQEEGKEETVRSLSHFHHKTVHQPSQQQHVEEVIERAPPLVYPRAGPRHS